MGLPFTILSRAATEESLRERIQLRGQRGLDPSDADWQVLDQQLNSVEVLGEDELPYSVCLAEDVQVDVWVEGFVAGLAGTSPGIRASQAG
jgi:predicted kinase